ncbi:uncharacterized protein [Cebidichthys violaceus]
MSDCEETDVFWESWSWTPGKGKKKKDPKKDKKCLKCKNNMTVKTDETIQKKKKKKNPKFKDAMEGRKERKKAKKKDRRPLEPDDTLIHTQAAVKPPTLNKHSVDKLKPDHDYKKKSRSKKKVAFDLSPDVSSVKPPRCASSPQHSPKKSVPSETAAVGAGERTGHSHANESQCTSEDVNSQDLFITQKTFRASPSQPSSDESSGKALCTSPPVFTPRDKLHTSMARKEQHRRGSYTCPQDLHQRHPTTCRREEHVQKPKTLQVLLTDEEEEEEEEQLSKAHQKWKWLKANITEERKVSHTHPAPSVSAYLSEQSPSLSKRHSRSSVSTGSTSTQTENFFTTQLSSYLSFCQKTRVTVHLEDLQPVDLSLPQRARKEQEDPSGHHPWSGGTGGKRGPALSPQSESEPKSADLTTSSEDEPPCRSGRLDLTQVRAVQMRLNESFFFKTKGERQSPRPESPLMKLVQGREVKSRKRH